MNLQVKNGDDIDIYRDTGTISHAFCISDDYLLIYKLDQLANLLDDAKKESKDGEKGSEAIPVAAYADFDWVKEWKEES